MDCIEMLRDFRDLLGEKFAINTSCYTIINDKIPRTLDIPMAQGLISFARRSNLDQHAILLDGGHDANHRGGRHYAFSRRGDGGTCVNAVNQTRRTSLLRDLHL